MEQSFGEELKKHKYVIQKLLNRQKRAITRMYPSTPIYSLLNEAVLIPAKPLLDSSQKSYTYQLLTLLDCHFTKQILPINLRKGVENSQSRKQPKNMLI